MISDLSANLPLQCGNIKEKKAKRTSDVHHSTTPTKQRQRVSGELNALLLTAASRWLEAATGKYHMPGMPAGVVMLTRAYLLSAEDMINVLSWGDSV